jgi:hypothetical protein
VEGETRGSRQELFFTLREEPTSSFAWLKPEQLPPLGCGALIGFAIKAVFLRRKK